MDEAEKLARIQQFEKEMFKLQEAMNLLTQWVSELVIIQTRIVTAKKSS